MSKKQAFVRYFKMPIQDLSVKYLIKFEVPDLKDVEFNVFLLERKIQNVKNLAAEYADDDIDYILENTQEYFHKGFDVKIVKCDNVKLF